MSDKPDIKWPADKVQRRPLAELYPYARNSRTHSAAQIQKIAASIEKWGWTVPVLVDETGMLIAGHGRVLAAQKLKISEIPVMVAEGWSEADKKAYVIADNALALASDWNDDILRSELSELKSLDFDLSLTGFDDREIKSLLEPEPPKAEEPKPTPGAPVSQPGDVWIMGSHRLEVGESDHAVADAICGLWHSHMDSPAVLEATGQSFAETMTERNPQAPVVPKLTRAKARDAMSKAGKPRAKKDDGKKVYH